MYNVYRYTGTYIVLGTYPSCFPSLSYIKTSIYKNWSGNQNYMKDLHPVK